MKVLNLINTVLVARLLTPTEIGTFAIASSVVMILTEIKMLGANSYLIREETIDNDKIRRAYGMSMLMCYGIASVLILGSWSISAFFGHAETQLVFVILALSFLFAPYISIPDALMARQYRFKEITLIEMSAVVVQVGSCLTMIALGCSLYSLAWAQVFGMMCRCALSLYFTRDVRVYSPKFVGLGEIAKLGIFISTANIVRRIHYTASDLVIGKMGTPLQVGMFSRGMGYIDFVSQSVLDGIASVAQPYMSDVKRRGLNVADAYVKATALLCSLVWPIIAVAGAASLPAIRLLFGDQWDQAAPIATMLSAWMFVKVLGFFFPQAFIAVGLEGRMFKRDLISFGVLLVMLIITFPAGLQVMALAFFSSVLVEVAISLWMLRHALHLSLRRFALALSKPFLVSLVCLAAALLLDRYYAFADHSPLVIFLLLAVSQPIVWLATVLALKLPIADEIKRLVLKKST